MEGLCNDIDMMITRPSFVDGLDSKDGDFKQTLAIAVSAGSPLGE